MAGKRGGRPSKLTPATQRKIVAAVRDGTPFKFAALAAGVDPRTLRRWLAAAKAGKNAEVKSLLSAVREAEARGVADKVRLICKAGKLNWPALKWLLESRFPDSFSTDRAEIKRLAKLIEEQAAELKRLTDRLRDDPPPTAAEGPAERPDADGPAKPA